jgi:hypothetical protein
VLTPSIRIKPLAPLAISVVPSAPLAHAARVREKRTYLEH